MNYWFPTKGLDNLNLRLMHGICSTSVVSKLSWKFHTLALHFLKLYYEYNIRLIGFEKDPGLKPSGNLGIFDCLMNEID